VTCDPPAGRNGGREEKVVKPAVRDCRWSAQVKIFERIKENCIGDRHTKLRIRPNQTISKVNVNGDTDLWRTVFTVNIEGMRVRKKDARQNVKMLFYFLEHGVIAARTELRWPYRWKLLCARMHATAVRGRRAVRYLDRERRRVQRWAVKLKWK